MAEDRDLLVRLLPLRKLLLVANKCDLPRQLSREVLMNEISVLAQEGGVASGDLGEAGQMAGPAASPPILFVSALTGEGMDHLRGAISKTALPALGENRESHFLTSVRQEHLVNECLHALSAASDGLEAAVPHEMLLLDLYTALRSLDA